MKPEERPGAAAHDSHSTNNRHRRASSLVRGPFGGGDHLWGGRIFTAEQLMAEQLPPVRWSVPGVLPEGLRRWSGVIASTWPSRITTEGYTDASGSSWQTVRLRRGFTWLPTVRA
jgi:hypothetical protein